MIDLQGFLTSRPTPAYHQHGQGWDRGALLWPHLTSIVKKNVFDTGLQLTLTMFRSKKKSRKIKTNFSSPVIDPPSGGGLLAQCFLC